MSKSMSGPNQMMGGNKNLPNERLETSGITEIINYYNSLPIGVNLYVIAGQTTPTGLGTHNIVYDSSTIYGDISYNSTTGVITINKSGFYTAFGMTLAMTNNGFNANNIRLRVSGSDRVQTMNIENTSTEFPYSLGLNLPLNAGDTVEMLILVGVNEAVTIPPANGALATSYFTLQMIGPNPYSVA